MLEERIRVGQVQQLDRFHADLLGCEPERLVEPGVAVLGCERRLRPTWGGYTVPLMALTTVSGGVVSCRPDLVEAVRAELAAAVGPGPLGEAAFERMRRIVRRSIPYAYSLSGFALYTDRQRFRPLGGLAERLLPTDQRGLDLRRRFDGEIFVVAGARGEIAAWSAIKLKSDDVWEIAVVTEAPYRGRGYARQVVSAATEHILRSGRIPLYVHDRANRASAKVCRSLGYVEYGEQYFAEY
jgi:GNAT superfamily N-acetyltransferase